MDFLIVGLLVLVFAAALANGQLLERENRRQFCQVKELLAELNGSEAGANTLFGEIRRELSKLEDQLEENTKDWLEQDARTTEALKGVWTRLEAAEEAEKQVVGAFQYVLERLNELPSRKDSVQAMEKLEALFREAPEGLSADDESRLSRSVEEGIANLLQYSQRG